MSTVDDLKGSYSFIGAFQSETILEPYGNNALPLFAVGLHLGVEDLATFATDSLTDGPDDKKADIIYINEAEGIACIAQGTTAADWGKPEAQANKASDLNTAAAWLLQQPIDVIPEAIRGHANLLRDGLSQERITRLTFAYAHNSLESENVARELHATRRLVSALEICQQCDVEVVELGLTAIEALYLSSRGSIRVKEEIQFPAGQYIEEKGQGWKAFSISINGATLFDLYEKHNKSLFSANLRDFLGSKGGARNVNNTIKTAAESASGLFYIYNNGITIVSNKADHEDGTLKIQGISVVNGAQTTGSIHAAGRDKASNLSVAARVIVVDDEAMIPKVVTANNTQNAIVAWDRRSNNAVQIRLRKEFGDKGIEYVHRRDNSRKPANSIFAEQAGQMLCAFGGNLQTAIRSKASIFEEDTIYNDVFPSTLVIGHVFAVQALGWAYDRIRQDLKAKVASTPLTGLEQGQLNLLAYPASKQFVIRVMGDLREEISGRGILHPREFVMKDKAITADSAEAIEAWRNVISAVLPSIVQNLPDEEYQVVRSNDHTKHVVERVQAIVAGAAILQQSFENLRGLLK
ncbi:MAG: AIPR family protein [Chloroflexi bacterium]|nr:AIPR family protein [Chloroflexota bacterium]